MSQSALTVHPAIIFRSTITMTSHCIAFVHIMCMKVQSATPPVRGIPIHANCADYLDDLYHTVLEPIIVFTMGYLSYILADLFEFSGIVR